MGCQVSRFLAQYKTKKKLIGNCYSAYAFNLISRYVHITRHSSMLERSTDSPPSSRYFQSQGASMIESRLFLTPTFPSGLFAVPTQIICIIAPVNALLNYLLSTLLPLETKTKFTHTHSMGPRSNPPRLHRRPHRDCLLIQPRLPPQHLLWRILRPPHGMAPSLTPRLEGSGCSCKAWAVWRWCVDYSTPLSRCVNQSHR